MEQILTAQRPRGTALVISDLHGPTLNQKALNWALGIGSRENVTAILVGGDFADFKNTSSHMPTSHGLSFEDELDSLRDTMQRLTKPGIPVYGVLGNHDLRVPKAIARALPSHFLDWTINPVRYFADEAGIHLPNRPDFEAWWMPFGDALLTHSELSPGVKSVSQKTLDVFRARSQDFGSIENPALVLSGHPHKWSAKMVGQVTVVDLDTLSSSPEYARVASGIKYLDSATLGCTLVTFKAGKFERDSLRHYVYS